MKTRLILFLLLLSCMPMMAQRKITVTGNIYDRVTTKELSKAHVIALTPDSTVAAEDSTLYREFRNNQVVESGLFYLNLPVAKAPYMLRISREGYETHEQPLDLSDLGRKVELKLPPIYLTPARDIPSMELDEVVVKTSKVKFYHKGDTIVYNADAFMLPEGSSLDALIAQLPGVEIRDGGKIYVNGKYVESLLLNGNDFFKGNQDVMRQNLGAYTVKDIAVYEKTGQISRLLGDAVEDDKEYVMDVRLKKDYMGGWMGNNQVGYGTDDRYSARLFDMYFNNNLRLTLYGNINNVSDTNKPNDGSWSAGVRFSSYTPYGTSKIANGGFDYLVVDPRKVWTVNGNVDAKYVDGEIKKNVFTESFLQNNSFQTSLSNDATKSFSISTDHRLKFDKERYYLNVNPTFRYNRNTATSSLASAEFSSNVQQRYDIDKAVIDAIYTGSLLDLREAIINRNRYYRENRANSYNARIVTEQSWKMAGSSDAITLWLEGKYDRDHGHTSTNQRIDYGFNGLNAPLSSSALLRDNRNYPSYEGQFIATTRYIARVQKSTISLGFEYRHHDQRRSAYEFIADTNAENGEALLPELSALAPDLANTNNSTLRTNVYKIMGMYTYNTEVGGHYNLMFTLVPQLHFRHRALNYHAFLPDEELFMPVNIPVKRTSASINNSKAQLHFRSKDGKKSLYITYSLDSEYASLTDMIDIPNTTDPLNIWRGNPDLKDGYRHDYSLFFYLQPKKFNVYINVGGQYKSRAQVKGYTFDSSTGVREFQTLNVSGDQSVSPSIEVVRTFTLGAHELTPHAQAGYNFARYANMIGEDGPMKKQMVNSNGVSYKAGIRYALLKKYIFDFGVRGNDFHSHTDGSRYSDTRQSFTQITAMTDLKLPLNLSVGASMYWSLYGGVKDSGLNPNQCIVNANINYNLNSHWSFKLQGYDLLAQQKPYSNVVSASGRVQTIVNTLPRYVMLTATYKFSTKKR